MALPACRSTTSGTCWERSLLLAALSLKPRGWPRRRTGMPAIFISTRDVSKKTPERPAAAKMRPQLGSAPAKAVLTSGDVAIVSAMRRASASFFALRTSISMTRCAPSPSATICSASEWQTSSRAEVNARCDDVPALIEGAPASPLARTTNAKRVRSEEHTSELQSRLHLVCRLLLEKKKKTKNKKHINSVQLNSSVSTLHSLTQIHY